MKVGIACGTVMSTIWLVFPIVWCLFSVKIQNVVGINSAVVFHLIHTMYMESVLILPSVTCSYPDFRGSPAIWCMDSIAFLCWTTELCINSWYQHNVAFAGVRATALPEDAILRDTCCCACHTFRQFLACVWCFWEQQEWNSFFYLAIQNNVQTNIPLAYTTACEAVWATEVFAFSSSFLSVDGMTCHISF
jgi:hypothetical protein